MSYYVFDVYFSGSRIFIGNYTAASLTFSMSTTFAFKKLPCRVMICLESDSSKKFYVDSEFILSSDSKSASLNIPLGNISEKLGNPKAASPTCTVAVF